MTQFDVKAGVYYRANSADSLPEQDITLSLEESLRFYWVMLFAFINTVLVRTGCCQFFI